MNKVHQLSLALLLIALSGFAALAQTTSSSEVLLTVGGEIPTALKLTRADLDKFTRHRVQVKSLTIARAPAGAVARP